MQPGIESVEVETQFNIVRWREIKVSRYIKDFALTTACELPMRYGTKEDVREHEYEILCDFPLGTIVATPRVNAVMCDRVIRVLELHAICDWGDGEIAIQKQAANQEALVSGGPIVSSYYMGEGPEPVVIFTVQGVSTMVMLESDYLDLKDTF